MSFRRRTAGQGDQMGFAVTVELGLVLTVDNPAMLERILQVSTKADKRVCLAVPYLSVCAP
jgi:hypothetical protein